MSWAMLVGGLLLVFAPRAMAGSSLELLVLVWRATRLRVGLILAWTGAWFGVGALLAWAMNELRLHVQVPTTLLLVCSLAASVPFLILALEIPPIGVRRRGRTTNKQPHD
jgi:hypothetical protein